MIFVNCVSLLANFPKSMILQNDGFHLSLVAQNLVGEAIGQAIGQAIVDDRTKNDGYVGDARRQQFG
jgi:hypothetical protein